MEVEGFFKKQCLAVRPCPASFFLERRGRISYTIRLFDIKL